MEKRRWNQNGVNGTEDEREGEEQEEKEYDKK